MPQDGGNPGDRADNKPIDQPDEGFLQNQLFGACRGDFPHNDPAHDNRQRLRPGVPSLPGHNRQINRQDGDLRDQVLEKETTAAAKNAVIRLTCSQGSRVRRENAIGENARSLPLAPNIFWMSSVTSS